MQLEFSSLEDALFYCERMGYEFYIQKATEKQPRAKSYGLNFSWNKKTRTSTK